jgi:TonB-linked SusC/RagA family outer membrane protein
MRKILFLFSVMMLSGILCVNAQTIQITGTVTSSEDGLGLPGVAVVLKGTTRGTITNLDGVYVLDVSPDDNLLNFSFVGMRPQDITIDARTVIDVVLDPDILGIEEVVVTAMGIRKEAKALGYAVQEVSGEEISKAKQADVSKALQGKVAGVRVRQSSGMPGATSLVTIRGSTSLSGSNQPLYVVDGIPIASGKAYGELVGEGTNPSNRILDLNPDDIESINVLKGATASALYGLRASNGVVVITTKSGEAAKTAGRNTLITFNTSYNFDRITRLPELQDKYAQGNNGQLDLYSPDSWGPLIDTLQPYIPQVHDADESLTEPAIYNNQEDFFRTGHNWTSSFDVSSSGETGNYSVGFGRTDQDGIIPTTGMKRSTARFNGSFKAGDKWTIGTSANFSSVSVDKIPGGNNLSNPLFTVYFAPRTYDLTNLPYEDPGNQYIQRHYRLKMDNPYWAIKHNSYKEETDRMLGNANFTYNPLDWLTLNYRIGIDKFTTTGKEVVSLGAGPGRAYPDLGPPNPNEPSGGQIDDYTYQNRELNSNLTVNFSKRYSDILDLTLLLGNEIYDLQSRMEWITGTGITIGGFNDIFNTSNQFVNSNSGISRQRIIGLYYSATLNFKSTLFITTTGRNDYVSNMPRGNRSFFYPSVDLGLIFTQLPMLQDNKFLPFGKLRLSFAQVGQAGALFVQNNSFNPAEHGSGFLSGNWMFPYQGFSAFSQSPILISKDLKPMNSKTFEAGLDLRFADDRVNIDYSFYNTNASDQIFSVPIASSTGFEREYRNAGKLRSRGHEVILKLKPVETKNFSWELTTNFSTNDNLVLELAEGVDRIAVGYQNFSEIGTYAYADNPYPVLFGSTYLRDTLGNMVMDTLSGLPQMGEEAILGKVNPDWETSIINALTFKGLTFTFQFDIKQGGVMSSGLNQLLYNYGAAKGTEDRDVPVLFPGVKGYIDNTTGELIITGPNDIETYKNEYYWATRMWNIAEAFVYETSYIRLREVVINYDIPGSLLKNTFIHSLSVYVNSRNLLLFTKYPNFDPEVSTADGNGTGGFEYVSLPNVKSFGGGIRLTF